MGEKHKSTADEASNLASAAALAYEVAFFPSPADRRIVEEATGADLDASVVDAIILTENVRHARSMAGASTREERMRRLNIVDENGNVRLCGLLAAGTYPQQFFPRFAVDVVVYPGTRKGTTGSVRYLDRSICEGPLHEVIDDATVTTARNLRTAGIVESVARIDEPEIPIAAIREAITNAVVHRDYSDFYAGQAVCVDVFSDRVVVQNPGGLWGGKTLENLGDGMSRCRNGALMRIAQSLPNTSSYGSPAEGAGTGIPLMTSEMAAAGLKPPVFEAGIDSFSVTLYRPGQLVDGDFEVVEQGREASIFAEGEAPSGTAVKSEVEYAVIDLLKAESPLGIRDIAEGIDVPIWTARRYVRKLIEKKAIAPTASATSRNRRYRLIEPQSAAAK